MRKKTLSAADFIPSNASLKNLSEHVQNCKGCDLYKGATQAVFGQGPRNARVVVIGEKPGNQEDLQGKPFVGPAGKLLNKALNEAGIDPNSVYITNAVKHFKWEARGKIRLHKKPSITEIRACRPWLEQEIKLLSPEVIVCLGSSATFSVFERKVGVRENRGRFLESHWSSKTLITIHPSAILRILEKEERDQAIKKFVKDLKQVAKILK